MFNRRAFLSLAALSIYPIGARSYVLPGDGIIREAKSKLKASKGLKVTLETQVWGSETRLMTTVSERWNFSGAGQLTILGSTSETAWSLGMDAPSASTFPGLDLRVILIGLFGMGGLDSVLSHLRIDSKKSRLGLLNKTPMLVVGTKTKQERAPEIWFNKRTWMVERLRFGALQTAYDLRLSDWTAPATQGIFPGRMTLNLNDRPIRLSKTVGINRLKGQVKGG